MAKVVIEFKSETQAEDFASWLCESGEQEYFTWADNTAQQDLEFVLVESFEYGNLKKGTLTVKAK